MCSKGMHAYTRTLTKSSLALTGLLALPAPGCRSSHDRNGRTRAYGLPVLQRVLHSGSPAIGGAGKLGTPHG